MGEAREDVGSERCFFCWERLRKSHMRIARRARESGIPTAQPTITGILEELEFEVDDGGGEPWV